MPDPEFDEKSSVKKKIAGEPGEEVTSRIHIGSSDAFAQTESTGSADADNISDEKLDDLLDKS